MCKNLNQSIELDNDLFYNHCPICQSNKIKKIGELDYYSRENLTYANFYIKLKRIPELWECIDCKSWFAQNIIKESDSISLYTKGEFIKRNSNEDMSIYKFENRKPPDIKKILSENLPQKSKVLDIGCDTGDLLDFLKKNGHTTFGLEYSKASRNILQKKGHIAYSNFAEINEKFDVITAFDLIEHIYNFQLFLDNCSNLLNSNGILVFFTGNIDSKSSKKQKTKWWYFSFAEHIIFPSKQAYETNDLKVIKYNKVRLDNELKITVRSLIRKIIRLFSLSYDGWPFNSDHHIIVLKKNT
ncbi:MAG: class I SAM-dependent methyltransferase [Clostridioides sp.]|jgi:2-polyprenyl-3-methyl-5-hydroxy-6-metoxy-1,4-benzoquinol methylase|nr:class I SAM-dependent methyltransferase [Clostridioides sp.]